MSVEMVADLVCGLPGELFDMCGGQANLEVGVAEEAFGEVDGFGEAFGDGAGVLTSGNAVAAEQRNHLGVGVEGGEPRIHQFHGSAW